LNNKGVTFIELLIYIVLFVVLSLLIGRQFRVLTSNYSSGKRTARQQTDTRDVLGLMVREIRNTGLKVYFTGSATARVKKTDKEAGVIVSAGTDSSSFIHTEGSANDKLTIKKLSLSRTGAYETTDKIDYYVDGTTLRRSFKTSAAYDSTNSVVAQNVHALQFQYGVLTKDSVIYDDDPINPYSWAVSSGGGTASMGGTNQLVLTLPGPTSGALKCSYNRTVRKNCTYNVRLKIIPSSSVFLSRIDSLRFAFKNNFNYYGVESFKPYLNDMVVPVHTSGSGYVDMVLEYNVHDAGSLVITGIEVSLAVDSAYTWLNNPVTPAVKENVRAIRVFVLMRSAGITGIKAPAQIAVGPITVNPPAGDYLWRVFEETIEVPNNGIF